MFQGKILVYVFIIDKFFVFLDIFVWFNCKKSSNSDRLFKIFMMQSVSSFLDSKYELERRFKKLLKRYISMEKEEGQVAEGILRRLERTRTKLEGLCAEVIF